MATPETTPAKDAAPTALAPRKARKGLLLGGGILGLAAAAYALSLVAVPKKPSHLELEGPFAADLSQEQYRVNLSQESGRHYLAMSLKAEVDAYDREYTQGRVADPLYQARLTDAVIRISAQKNKRELDQKMGREVFREELRTAVEPVLFPLHLGDPTSPDAAHAESGLRLSLASERSTLRGLFYEHALHVDARARTVALDGGPAISFQGGESELEVRGPSGQSVWIDLSGLDPEFVGEVHVGVMGRVRGIYFSSFLTQ